VSTVIRLESAVNVLFQAIAADELAGMPALDKVMLFHRVVLSVARSQSVRTIQRGGCCGNQGIAQVYPWLFR